MVVNFGFIREKLEIKMLILFIVRRFPIAISTEVLAELVVCDAGIGFFDYAECLSELVDTGHLTFDGSNYSLTEKGARNGEITENSLPLGVRIRADEAVSKARIAVRRDSNIETFRTQRADGRYDVNLSMSDGVGTIIKLDLFAPDKQQAIALEKGFRKNAEKVYNAVLETIFG